MSPPPVTDLPPSCHHGDPAPQLGRRACAAFGITGGPLWAALWKIDHVQDAVLKPLETTALAIPNVYASKLELGLELELER